MTLTDVNRSAWDARYSAGEYAGRSGLFEPERIILQKYAEHFYRRAVLDIGCGAGRFTAELLGRAGAYTGIDYSGAMVRRCRERFPGADIRQMDMRSMTAFNTASFDAVVCPFNVLDYVSCEDRLVTLHEVRRVLASSGLLVFSSHNRACAEQVTAPRLFMSYKPHVMLARVIEFVVGVLNHRRLRGQQIWTDDYAIVNDGECRYSMLTCYMSRKAQAAQLREAGFQLVEEYDKQGRVLAAGEADAHSSWIYYVARPLEICHGGPSSAYCTLRRAGTKCR